MVNEKVGGGIQTGTPTEINASCSQSVPYFCKKSGNVVTFTLSFSSASDIPAYTKICKMPWAPTDQTDVTITTNYGCYPAFITTAGELRAMVASGTGYSFYGTYLTND